LSAHVQTDRSCHRGHGGLRYASTGQCVDCMKERYQSRREQIIANVKAAYKADPEAVKRRVKEWKAANRERVRELEAKGYRKNKAKRLAWHRKHHQNNRDRFIAEQRAWREQNRERINAEARERHERLKSDPAYIEAQRERQRKYYALNKEKGAVKNSARRAKILNAEGEYTENDVKSLFARQKGRCACCGQKKKLTVDHIVPLTRGGSNWPRNLQGLCLPCNSAKQARDPVEFMQKRGRLL
jgi:5-methylcytosine-specific restriction endonuclease McrA